MEFRRGKIRNKFQFQFNNNNVNVYQNVWIPKIELVSNSQWSRRDDSTVDDCREIWLQLEIDYLEYTLTLAGPVFCAQKKIQNEREKKITHV